jgi:hypothetical protein
LVLYAYLCVFAHSRFVENPPIWSWETNPSFLRWYCHRRRRNIRDDCRLDWSLRHYVGNEDILHKLSSWHFLNHHHNLRCLATTAKRSLGDVENLNQDIVEDAKWLIINIVLDEVPLILRTSGVISNPRSQGGAKKAVKATKLWQEGVNLWLHSVLVLKATQGAKLKNIDLILSLISHPHKPLTISIKVECGVERHISIPLTWSSTLFYIIIKF